MSYRASFGSPRAGADVPAPYRESRWVPIGFIAAMLGVAYVVTARATAKIHRQRDATRGR